MKALSLATLFFIAFSINGDTFTEVHQKVSQAARIFAGIALRVGIHNGTVTGDKLISEMLNLDDSISLDEVAGFDKTKIDGFFTKIAGLTNPSSEAIQLKEKILALDSMRLKFGKVRNPNDTSSIDAYINTVVAFKQENVNYTFFTSIPVNIESLMTPLRQLADLTKRNMLKEGFLTGIRDNLVDVDKIPDKIQGMLQKFSTHEVLFKADFLKSEIVKQFNLIQESARLTSKVFWLPQSSVNEFNGALTAVNNLKTDFDAARSHLNVAVQVANSLSLRNLSHGFINGFADVVKLRNDVQDTWLSTSIKDYDSALIKSELKPLEQFETSFTGLERQWKHLNDWQTVDKIATILKPFGTSADDTLLKNVAVIKSFNGNFSYPSSIEKLVDNILKLHQTLSVIRSNLTMIRKTDGLQNLKTLTDFKKHIDFSNGQTVSEVISKMPPFEELDKLITLLENLKPTLDGINFALTQNNPNTLAGNIETDKAKVATFINDPDRMQHLTYFEGLSGLSLDKLIGHAYLLETTQEIKKDASTFIPALGIITDNLSDSLQNLKNLRSVPAAIKSTSTSRIGELIQLQGLENHLETIGEAVMVFDKVQIVLSNRSDIEKFLVNGWRVNATVQVPNKQLAEDWRGFAELASYFEDLFAKLDIKIPSLRSVRRIRRRSSALMDLVNRMSKLKDLPDLDVNLKPIMTLLKTVTTIPNGAEMLNTLEAVNRMDLRFSSHNAALANVRSSFSSAIGLFSQAQTVSAAPGAPPVVSNSPQDPTNNQPTKLAKVDANDSEESGITSWIAIIFFSLLALLVVAGCLFYWLRKTKPVPAPPVAPEVPVDPVTPVEPQPTPETPADAQHAPETPVASTTKEEKVDEVKKVENVATVANVPKAEKIENPSPNVAAAPSASTATVPEESARDISLSPKTLEDYKKDLFFLYAKRKIFDLYLAKVAEGLKKKYVDMNKKEREKLESDISDLEKKVPSQIQSEVQTMAEKKVNIISMKVLKFQEQLTANVFLDEQKYVKNVQDMFQSLGGKDLLLQFKLSDDVWKLSDDGVYTSTRVLTDAELKFCLLSMLDFEITLETMKMVEPEKTRPEQSCSVVLRAFKARILCANEEVEKLAKTMITKSKDVTSVTCANDAVIVFDHAIAETDEGEKINGSVFTTPYGMSLYILAYLGNNVDKIYRFIWQKAMEFVVSWELQWVLPHTQGDEFEVTSEEISLTDIDGEIYGDGTANSALMIKTLLVTLKKKSGETFTYTHISILGWNSDVIPKESSYGKKISALMRHVTRNHGKPVAFVDMEGADRAASLVLSEQIASSISTYGILEAEIILQLIKLLSSRGRMFQKALPEYVMFAVVLAMDRLHKEAKCYDNNNMDGFWSLFESCMDIGIDKLALKNRWGDKIAKEYGMNPADDVDTIDEFENCFPPISGDGVVKNEVQPEARKPLEGVKMPEASKTAKDILAKGVEPKEKKSAAEKSRTPDVSKGTEKKNVTKTVKQNVKGISKAVTEKKEVSKVTKSVKPKMKNVPKSAVEVKSKSKVSKVSKASSANTKTKKSSKTFKK